MLQFHVWYHITTHQHKIVFKKRLLKQKINDLNQQFKVTVFLSALKVNKSRTPTARKDFLLLKPTGHTWHYLICQLLDQQKLPSVPGAAMMTSSDEWSKYKITNIWHVRLVYQPFSLEIKFKAIGKYICIKGLWIAYLENSWNISASNFDQTEFFHK